MFKNQHNYIIATVLFCIPLFGVAIDISVPSLPAISQYFGVIPRLSKLIISWYLFGMAIAQFVVGNISDRIGRKPVFTLGITVFIAINCIIIILIKDIHQLLILRFIQGVSAALIIVPLRAILADISQGKEYYKLANYATISWALGPIVAPAIGGYLQHYYGWHIPLLFLSFYGTVCMALFVFIPETLVEKKKISITKIFHDYKLILTNMEYISGVFIQGLLYSILVIFNVVAPFLLEVELHYTAIQFGNVALLMGMAWMIGSLTNRLFAEFDMQRKIKYVLLTMSAIIITAFSINLQLLISANLLIISSMLITFLASIIYPNFFAKNTILFQGLTGTAGAIAGSICFALAALSANLASYLHSDATLHLIGAYLIIIFFLWVFFLIQYKLFLLRINVTVNPIK